MRCSALNRRESVLRGDEKVGPGLIDVSGASPIPEPETVRLLSECAVSASRAVDLTTAPDPRGIPILRRVLGNALGCPPDTLAITVGVRAAVPLLAPLLREVAVEKPSFEGIPHLAQVLGCNVRRSTWDEIMAGGFPAVWLTHPGRTPDGASLSHEQFDALSVSHGVTVVNEIYRWHSEPDGPPRNFPDGWFTVGSLAKIFGPAARVGWIRSAQIRRLDKHALRACSPPALVQAMWAHFLMRGGLDSLRATAIRACRARRTFCEVMGPGMLAPGHDGPSVLVKLPGSVTSDDILSELSHHGIKASNGRHFAAGDHAIRLTFTGVSADQAAHVARALSSVLTEKRH